MITFDQSKKVVKLSNGSIDYVVYINTEGYLETVYFGKSIHDFSLSQVRSETLHDEDTYVYDIASETERHFVDGFKYGVAPLEISPEGRRDKRGAPIVCQKTSGSFTTDFLYVSHRISDGIEPLADLPAAHGDNCQTVEFLLKERTRELYVKHRITIFDDCDVIVKNFQIVNKTGLNVTLSRAMSMQLDLPRNDYTLVHFGGRWANERNSYANKLVDGVQEVTSNYGVTSHEENAFVYLAEDGATYTHGEVVGFNLVYGGNFKFRTFSDCLKGTHVTYGINDEDFAWVLADGETFVTPQAVVCYSSRGVDGMTNNMHDFVRNHIVGYRHDKQYKPVLFNSWEGCYFDFTTDSILSYIDRSVEIGAELFVLDDGWFGRRNDDRDGLGDWQVNTAKIDLGKVVEHCHAKGVKFGIWFEPEMINYTSDLYKAHPEFALQETDSGEVMLGRHQMNLDMTRDDVVDNIYRQMVAVLDKYDIDYVKWDYNRRVFEHYSEHLGAERQGEVYHRLALGYYKLLGKIAARYPDMMIEGCAGGGGRFELGTLCFCPQIWTSDESNPARRSTINYNTSLGYPLCTMGTHVNDCKLYDYRAKGLFALFGTYGYEMNPELLTADEKKMLGETAALYKKYHKNVVENGDMYHLVDPSDGNYYIVQCVSKDKSTSLVLSMNMKCQKDCFRFVKLRGLDPDKRYTLDGGDTYYGDYFANVGINLSREWHNEFECRLFVLEEAK